METTKPETMCRREPKEGDASPSSSVGSSAPEKPRGLQPAESVVREVPLTPVKTAKMTEVISTLTKSQKEAQEMSDYVTKLAEEIKQLRVSRAREETVRAKGACVGEARKKLAHAWIPERIKYQGENVSETQDQSGTLYEDAKRFLAGTSNFMSFGDSRIEQRHGGVGLGMKPYEREEEVMVQPNTRRRGRNRKPRLEPGYDEYGEYQEP